MQEQAVLTAERAQIAVQHPLLNNVRQCSGKPDAAADFFLKMLHPTPACRIRLDGFQHAYMSQTLADMKAFHALHSPKSVLRSHPVKFDEGKLQGTPFQLPEMCHLSLHAYSAAPDQCCCSVAKY